MRNVMMALDVGELYQDTKVLYLSIFLCAAKMLQTLIGCSLLSTGNKTIVPSNVRLTINV